MPLGSSPSETDELDTTANGGASDSTQNSVADTSGSATGDQDGNSADSSAAGQDAGPKSTLDAVRAALGGGEDSGSSAAADGEKDPAKAGADGKAKPPGEAEQEAADKALPFHNHPRWKQVQAELKQLRPLKKEVEQLRETAKQVEQFKQSHDKLQSLVAWTRDAGLNGDEVNTGLEIMRLMKNDPVKAWEALQPYVAQLQTVIGDVLPKDLQTRVDNGELSRDDALAISRSRSREGLSRAAAENAARKADEIRQSTETERFANAVGQSLTAWERNWQGRDPDYQRLQPYVMKEIKLAIAENGLPKSVQDAVKMADTALETVKNGLKSFIPARAERKPNVTGGAGGSTTPQPKSTLDVIRNTLKAAG
jgi:hypothetical protein